MFPLSVRVNQVGKVGAVIVAVSPSSSDTVIVYEYTLSSSTVVTAVLVKVGASFTLTTAIVKLCSLYPPDASVARNVTELFPTFACNGVPVIVAVLSPLSEKDNQPGNVGAVIVVVSPS